MYKPEYQERVEVSTRYIISPIRGGKRLQGVYLRLDSGEVWIRSYRPIPEEYEFSDKRVVVTGRPYTNSPYVQSVGGVHFELESIRLADGEIPHDPKPLTLLPPPNTASKKEFDEREGRWANCSGTLLKIEVHQVLVALT